MYALIIDLAVKLRILNKYPLQLEEQYSFLKYLITSISIYPIGSVFARNRDEHSLALLTICNFLFQIKHRF